jgi:cysteine sulfinate desulfinase/cysteine desulfurase-like protein
MRLSLGIYNTDADVDYLLEHLPPIIVELRSHKHTGKHHHKPHAAVET